MTIAHILILLALLLLALEILFRVFAHGHQEGKAARQYPANEHSSEAM